MIFPDWKDDLLTCDVQSLRLVKIGFKISGCGETWRTRSRSARAFSCLSTNDLIEESLIISIADLFSDDDLSRLFKCRFDKLRSGLKEHSRFSSYLFCYPSYLTLRFLLLSTSRLL